MKLPRGPVLTRDQAVYLMHVPALGYFKIGRSNDPDSRRINLQIGCPEPVYLVGASAIDPEGLPAHEFEIALHQALTLHRTSGEWFNRITLETVIHTWGVVWNDLVDLYQPKQQQKILQMHLPF